MKNFLERKRYFIVQGDTGNVYQQNGKYIKKVENDKITFDEKGANVNGTLAEEIDVNEFKHLKEQAYFDRLYFCHGCKFFSAMIEDDYNPASLKSADINDLNRPSSFVLTHCTNKYNRESTEGNTRQEVCPLEKFKK